MNAGSVGAGIDAKEVRRRLMLVTLEIRRGTGRPPARYARLADGLLLQDGERDAELCTWRPPHCHRPGRNVRFGEAIRGFTLRRPSSRYSRACRRGAKVELAEKASFSAFFISGVLLAQGRRFRPIDGPRTSGGRYNMAQRVVCDGSAVFFAKTGHGAINFREMAALSRAVFPR